MGLPFTTDRFLDVFAEYNRALWPFAVALWAYAFVAVVLLARREASGRFVALLLSAEWAWAAGSPCLRVPARSL